MATAAKTVMIAGSGGRGGRWTRPRRSGRDDDEEQHQAAAPMTGHQSDPMQADNAATWVPRMGLGPGDDAANATDRATLLKPWSGGTAHLPGGSTLRRSSHGQARPRWPGPRDRWRCMADLDRVNDHVGWGAASLRGTCPLACEGS